MADRRTDDAPLAPRRSLGAAQGEATEGAARSRPVSERISGAVSTAAGTLRERGDAARASSRERGSRAAGAGSQPASGSRPRSTRRARLRLTHVDPWSVMKTSFLLAVAVGIVTVIAVAVVWSVLGAAGVWESINRSVQEVIGGESGATFDVENYVGTSRVMGFTMVVAAVDVVLITAIATLGAFLYNLAAALLGGIEVTLAEDDR
jgi:hypothetical protein